MIKAIGQGGFGKHQQRCGEALHRGGVDPASVRPTDPSYPGRTFTGNCVKANLVFGFTSEDDMCILPGYYYDADIDAAPGQECVL